MAILLELEDDDGANGLTEDWTAVERVCRRHDEKWMGTLSTTIQPTSGGQMRVASDNAMPSKEESSSQNGPVGLNIEALIREAYEIMKMRVEVEEGSIMESGSRGPDDKEVTSSGTKDGAYAKAEEWHHDTNGEGVE